MTVPIDGLGPGYAIGCIGQSNILRWFIEGPSPGTTPNANTREYTGSWSTFGAAQEGAKIFANALQASRSAPVGLLSYAISGSSVVPGSSPNDWQKGGSLYSNFVTACTTIGGCDGIVWYQGESESQNSTYYLQYAFYLTQLINDLRADITNASGLSELPFLIVSLARSTDTARQDGYQYVRDQQIAVAEQLDGVYICAAAYDQALQDSLHPADFTTIAQRCAVSMEEVLAGTPSDPIILSPHITGISVVSATQTDVLIDLAGATDFTPLSAIEGFKVFENGGGEKAISAAAQQTTTSIRLTHASVTGDRTVTYAYGADANITSAQNPAELADLVRDNSAVPRAMVSKANLTTATVGGGGVSNTDIARSITRSVAT